MAKAKQKDYKKLADRIYDFYKQERKMPSFTDLKAIFGVSSKDTVFRITNTMEGLGLIEKDKDGKLIPVKSEFLNIKHSKQKSYGIAKMLSTVEAGFPTYVEISDLETITLDEWLLGDKRATFILRVKGESMRDAGILDGDYVVVERGREPKNGDVVLAEVDGNWTLKYYRKDKSGITLVPANKNFPIIRAKESLEIPAVVVSTIRKYKN
jgi:repressor LexA